MFVVTGGAGFIGSALVWYLNRQGINDILVVDQLPSAAQATNLSRLQFRDYVPLSQLWTWLAGRGRVQSVEGIFHLGACSSTLEQNQAYLESNNFEYSRRLAQWCLQHNTRYIYASSASTYGNGEQGYCDDDAVSPTLKPMNLYGWSKQKMDLWALRTGAARHIVGLKFFNVFGPNEYHKQVMSSVVYKAYQQISKTGRLQLFKSHRPDYADGQQCRDFVYVKDCVEVMWWLWNTRRVNGIYNLGTGQPRTWNDLGHAVFSAMGLPAQIDYIDMPADLQRHYQYYTAADLRKLRAAGCEHEFRTLEAAVHDYVTQYLAAEQPYLDAAVGCAATEHSAVTATCLQVA